MFMCLQIPSWFHIWLHTTRDKLLDLKVFCSSSLVHFSFKISCVKDRNGYNLSTPKTEKFSKDCENGCVRYGLSFMQGWRTTMEDAQFVCRPPCVIVFWHITAPMLADEEDKISVLALMDLMAPNCDISVLDGLKYVSRFGIPLKKYWKT